MTSDEDLLDALNGLVGALQQNNERNLAVIARAQKIQEQRRAGLTWTEIVADEGRPLIVELLSQNLAAIGEAGSRVRRLQAQALHAEGMSMERISKLFGVTRQRIAELLRQPDSGGRGST
jgi:hypothetical protein